MIAKEILNNHLNKDQKRRMSNNESLFIHVQIAMEEYAKQEAEAFAEWICLNKCFLKPTDCGWEDTIEKEIIFTSELWNEYLKNQQP